MTDVFERFFKSSQPARDKYVSRLFGIFSEGVVRIWCAQADAPYEDLGRPTVYETGIPRGSTLDFTLRERCTGLTYVAELKCELEYDNYKYLQLTHANQLRHHVLPAFRRFLLVARNPSDLTVKRQGKSIKVEGAILVWGAVTPVGREDVMREFGFADVLSIEGMLKDLAYWAPESWTAFVHQYRSWTGELFDFLEGKETSDGTKDSLIC